MALICTLGGRGLTTPVNALGPGKIPVSSDYFPSKVFPGIRYIQSQNIPEPGA